MDEPTPAPIIRPRLRIALVTVEIGAVALTLGIQAVNPDLILRDRPSIGAGVETAAGLIALLTAYLSAGRFTRTARRTDLALATALAVLALTNLLYSTFPSLADKLEESQIWSAVIGHVIAAAMFTYAGWTRSRLEPNPRRAYYRSGGLLLGALLISAFGGAALAAIASRPTRVDPSGVHASGVLLAALITGGVLYAIAAFGFLRRYERTSDELMAWLAGGTALAAASRLAYCFTPSIEATDVALGDFLRLGFFGMMLVGAAREILQYQRSVARLALSEERRRVARDLHDGLQQDLAFLASQTAWLESRQPDDPVTRRIAAAARQALDDSRATVTALNADIDAPLAEVVAGVARELTSREDVGLELAIDRGVDVTPEQRQTIARIVREAVANGIRHGGATTIRVELAPDPPRVVVRDDGRGFDPDAPRTHGFGLLGMRERAAGMGAAFQLISDPGHGTTIEVRLNGAGGGVQH